MQESIMSYLPPCHTWSEIFLHQWEPIYPKIIFQLFHHLCHILHFLSLRAVVCRQNHQDPTARFGEHRRAVQANNPLYSTARHFTTHHQQNIADLNVWVIESIPDQFTPAERFQRLCRQETFWIFTLNSLAPNGLNEDIEINTVI